MILIYVPEINERIKYIFTFIFEEILGISFRFTNCAIQFTEETSPKFSYSFSIVKNEIHYSACNLLFETDIKTQNLREVLNDPFATAFFLLSRYEEYLPYQKDIHYRFSYKASSIKDKIDPLVPWIDTFAYKLFDQLKKNFPSLNYKARKFTYINTIDIDHAWLYKNKFWFKKCKALGKNILTFRWKDFHQQILVLAGLKSDPYYMYPYIQKLEIPTIYFISFGLGSQWDTNHDPKNSAYQELILQLYNQDYTTIGLHPSYFSNKDFTILKKEKLALEKLVKQKITISRQHFIKLHLPETYDNLIRLNITADFSMGFQDHIGFRAGTCTPFYWFDLKNNHVTELKVYPFCVMDVTLKNYMQLSIEEAENKLLNLLHAVKKVNGTFISIFHNDSLSNHGEWKLWKNVYEKLIRKANDLKVQS